MEILERSKPSVAHLRIFGCGVYVPNPSKTALGAQRTLGIYVGFQSKSKLRYLVPDTGHSFEARFEDCVFDETIYPTMGTGNSSSENVQRESKELEKQKEALFTGEPSLFPETINQQDSERLAKETLNLSKVAQKAPHAFTPAKGVIRDDGAICNPTQLTKTSRER
jgi:hypothetical protein